MEGLRTAWTCIYLIGLSTFVVLAVAMVPLGLRDLIQLLRELAADKSPKDVD